MKVSKKSIFAILKLSAVYAFALSTAIACGKFQGNTTVKKTAPGGSANGSAQVTREGTPGPVSDGNITIDKVETVFLGETEFSEFAWSLKINVTHGGRAIVFDTNPSVNPFNEDGVQKEIAPMTYIARGVCGNESCSKFAVLVDVTDTTNGTSFQRVQYWNLHINNSAPQKSLTNSDFPNVTAAYEALSFEQLPIN